MQDARKAPVVSGIIDFRTPAAGFDQPIEMWLACHERILRMLALLIRLRDHLTDSGAIESAQVTAASIRRYFEEAVPRHHEDEEGDLFPRLLNQLEGVERMRIGPVLDALRDEHPLLDRAWAELRPTLTAIEAGTERRLDDHAVVHFVTIYRQHVERENELLAPAFERVFDGTTLEAIGRAMAGRRGVNWEELRARK